MLAHFTFWFDGSLAVLLAAIVLGPFPLRWRLTVCTFSVLTTIYSLYDHSWERMEMMGHAIIAGLAVLLVSLAVDVVLRSFHGIASHARSTRRQAPQY